MNEALKQIDASLDEELVERVELSKEEMPDDLYESILYGFQVEEEEARFQAEARAENAIKEKMKCENNNGKDFEAEFMSAWKETFENMLHDWKTDHAADFGDLIIGKAYWDSDLSNWAAAAENEKAKYLLCDDGTGNISLNYVGNK